MYKNLFQLVEISLDLVVRTRIFKELNKIHLLWVVNPNPNQKW